MSPPPEYRVQQTFRFLKPTRFSHTLMVGSIATHTDTEDIHGIPYPDSAEHRLHAGAWPEPGPAQHLPPACRLDDPDRARRGDRHGDRLQPRRLRPPDDRPRGLH